jgi:hypothetical protein
MSTTQDNQQVYLEFNPHEKWYIRDQETRSSFFTTHTEYSLTINVFLSLCVFVNNVKNPLVKYSPFLRLWSGFDANLTVFEYKSRLCPPASFYGNN